MTDANHVELNRDLTGYQQGDVIAGVPYLMVHGPNGWSRHKTPLGFVLLSQTCDVVQSS
jgi:hypothetical protein